MLRRSQWFLCDKSASDAAGAAALDLFGTMMHDRSSLIRRIGRFGIFRQDELPDVPLGALAPDGSTYPETPKALRKPVGVFRVEMITRTNTKVKADDRTGSKHNTMDLHFFDELFQTFDYLSRTDTSIGSELRCVVLHSSVGSHFSSGLDLKSAGPVFFKDASLGSKVKAAASVALGATPSVDEPGLPAMRNMHLRRVINVLQESISAVAECRVPVIGAVSGVAYGGAIDLTTACDMRFATADSRISVKEANVGIVADLGTLQRLPPIVGQGIAREWSYTGRNIDASAAKRAGFFNEMLDTEPLTMLHSLKVASEIAVNSSPLAVQGTKHVMNRCSEKSAREGLDYVRLWNSAFLKSDDLMAASSAFANKKTPNWSGTQFVVDERPRAPPE